MKNKRPQIGWIGFLLSWTLLLGWNLQAAEQRADSPKNNVIFRLQFQGENQFGQSTNAATFKQIWSLPSTRKLLALCLDKLTRATMRFYPEIPPEEHPAFLALVRPLFDDFLKRESYLEMRGPTNQVHWLAAIQSDAATANRWSQQIKQLSSKLSLNKITIQGGPENQGWMAASEETGFTLKFSRTKHWVTVMGGPNLAETFRDVDERLAKLESPGPQLEDRLASVTLDPVSAAFWLPALDWLGLPPVELIAQEAGPYIRTSIKFKFQESQPMNLEAWDMPRSAIRNPQNSLASFLAMRGIRGWLHKIKGLSDMKADLLPNQFISWGQSQFSGQTLMAAPVADLTNTINALAYKVPKWVSTAFANSYTKVSWASNRAELIWQGLPILSPFLKPLLSDGKAYLSMGAVPSLGATNPPTPVELFAQLDNPDLFYYHWEVTDPRLLHYRHYVQLGLIMDRRQAMDTNDVTFHWIQTIHKRLGNSITAGTRVSPTELHLERKSHLGLTSAEIVFLTQWLRSEGFPYSFQFPGLVQPPPEFLEEQKAIDKRKQRQQNAPPKLNP